MRAYIIAVFFAIVVVAVAHEQEGKVDAHEEVVAHLKREIAERDVKLDARAVATKKIADREATGMGEAYDSDTTTVIQHTNGKISVTATTACNSLTIAPQHTMHKCSRVIQAHNQCTQGANTPAGFWDYTDSIVWIACGDVSWNDAIAKYSKWQLWNWGHTADISLVGSRANWDGIPGSTGNFMVFNIIGKQSGSDVECKLEAGVKLLLCNSQAADWSCTCSGSELIKVEQGAKMVDGTAAACGEWFGGATTMFNMLLANVRNTWLTQNPVTKKCLLNTLNPN